VIVNVIATMGIDAPFTQTGAVLRVMAHSAVPIAGKFIMDLTNKKCQFFMDTWLHQQKIASFVSESVCVVKHLPTVRTHSNWAILGKEQPITNVIQPRIDKVW
jgi:uncharacterized membrane protein